MFSPQQGRLGLRVAEDGLEDAQQWFGQHVGEVVHRVDRDVVLQNVNRILKFRDKLLKEFITKSN